MHKLEDTTLITTALLRRFHAEAEHEGGDGRYHALVQTADGHFRDHQIGPAMAQHALVLAMDLLSGLNRQLHHDGAWTIVFTHYRVTPPLASGEHTRFVILWLDADGDVQLPIEFEGDTARAISFGPIHWLQNCETAWSMWKRSRAILDLREGETFLRAKGQARPTLH